MKRWKKIFFWFVCCIIVFLISLFLHECGHGFANKIRGIECSTSFNRVGDIYKYPKDADFRAEYSLNEESLLDFGVPVTLALAILGTVVFYHNKNKTVKYIGLLTASTNSLIRLIPCLLVVLTPLLTGEIHVEDEYGTGVLLTEMTGVGWVVYLPAMLSIVISVVCISFLFRKLHNRLTVISFIGYAALTVFSFGVTMYIADFIDNVWRINWKI